jgi:hypothetical protein
MTPQPMPQTLKTFLLGGILLVVMLFFDACIVKSPIDS